MLSKPRPLAPCVTSSEPEDHRQFNQSWAFSSTLFRASQQGIGHQRQPPLFGTGPRHKYRQNSEEPVVKHPWWVFCSLRGRSGGGQRAVRAVHGACDKKDTGSTQESPRRCPFGIGRQCSHERPDSPHLVIVQEMCILNNPLVGGQAGCLSPTLPRLLRVAIVELAASNSGLRFRVLDSEEGIFAA